ncbi:hypothetical protein GY14_07530 [Delftia tsuruhatensis]|nr:hypothetical protein GY14_07530 [Delftia tsuruhatensis]
MPAAFATAVCSITGSHDGLAQRRNAIGGQPLLLRRFGCLLARILQRLAACGSLYGRTGLQAEFLVRRTGLADLGRVLEQLVDVDILGVDIQVHQQIEDLLLRDANDGRAQLVLIVRRCVDQRTGLLRGHLHSRHGLLEGRAVALQGRFGNICPARLQIGRELHIVAKAALDQLGIEPLLELRRQSMDFAARGHVRPA